MKDEIIAFIKENSGKKLRKTMIRRALCKNDLEKDLFKTNFRELRQDGVVLKTQGGIYSLSEVEHVEGTITVKDGAFGFVDISEDEDSIFIPPNQTGGAFTGDTVKVHVTDRHNSKGPVGKVIELISSPFQFIHGQLLSENNKLFVRPLRFGASDISVQPEDVSAFEGLVPGDWVKVELLERTSKTITGRITEKTGDAGDLNVELDAIISEFDIEPGYTVEEEKSAGRLKQRPIERKDLTAEVVMTIDPIDAKDFDDALSVHEHEDPKLITIGVHIADVAAYISPNGVWQKKVRSRSFTAYLPGRMMPMLPRVLVSKRCSLNENELKPAHTVMLHINRRTGKVESFERFHSNIIVKKRLNYEEVQEFADKGFKNKEWPKEVREPLKLLYQLSAKIRGWRRSYEKFIPLEAPEVRVMCDHRTMELKGLKHEKAAESNQLVEEFMLAANVAVAKELTNRQIPGLFRVHPEPDPESVAEFTAKACSIYGLNPGDLTNRSNSVAFLNQIKELDDAEVISYDFLRMMQRALYSETAALHYGLGKGLYSHFTSPIRRMSDLIVHQQLWEDECNRKIQSKGKLELEASHITEMERKNDDAYRAASHRFKLYYIRQQVDKGEYQNVTAFISKIGHSNLKIYIQEFGLYTNIYLRDFEDDYYNADDHGRFIQGKRTNRVLNCGDPITIKVTDVNFARRDINVKPVLEPISKKKGGKKTPKVSPRRIVDSDSKDEKPKKKKFFEKVYKGDENKKKRSSKIKGKSGKKKSNKKKR
ncbi:MAG: ribonuclease R [Lentisphaeraceae bacterium]|nr:ribonuclease R [Lentisphaeraceae bacterium]